MGATNRTVAARQGPQQTPLVRLLGCYAMGGVGPMASSGSEAAARDLDNRSRNTRGCPSAYRRRFRHAVGLVCILNASKTFCSAVAPSQASAKASPTSKIE